MTTLKEHYHQQSQIHIPTKSKIAIHGRIFDHITWKNTTYPSLWSRLARYQSLLTNKYIYAMIITSMFIIGSYQFDMYPSTIYKINWDIIVTQSTWKNLTYANQVGTIVSTSGAVEIVHQWKQIDSTSLYGGDTILLSNKSYMTFMLDSGYIWSVSGPAKFELHHQNNRYQINVLEWTIFAIKTKEISPSSYYPIEIHTTNFNIKTTSWSVDLTIIQNDNHVIIQNKWSSKLYVQNKWSNDTWQSIDTTKIAQISSQNNTIYVKIIPYAEAKLLITQLQDFNIDASYTVDRELLNTGIIWEINKSITTNNIDLINTGIQDVTQPVLIARDNHTKIWWYREDTKTITNKIDQTTIAIEQIVNISSLRGQTIDQDFWIKDEDFWIKDEIMPLLDNKTSITIIALLIKIRTQLDEEKANIDSIETNINTIRNLLAMKPIKIQTIDQLPLVIEQINTTLQWYTLDPKIIYHLNRINSAYKRLIENNAIPTNDTKNIQTGVNQSWQHNGI
jgi:hypothetical protein